MMLQLHIHHAEHMMYQYWISYLYKLSHSLVLISYI